MTADDHGVILRVAALEHPGDLLRRVLAPGALTSLKQPVVRLRDGEVVGWEALARLRDEPSLSPLVSGWSLAARGHGGEGAWYVRLRR